MSHLRLFTFSTLSDVLLYCLSKVMLATRKYLLIFIPIRSIYSVKKVPGIDHSESPLKEIVKNLFDAQLAPLSSILAWSSSAICYLVCSQCSMLSIYLKCVSRFFQWLRISNKEFVSNFASQMKYRVRNC